MAPTRRSVFATAGVACALAVAGLSSAALPVAEAASARALLNKGGKWGKVPGRTMQNVRTVYIANDGHIWVGTSSGLYILDPSGKKPVVRLGRQDVLLSSNVLSKAWDKMMKSFG
mgnify:CR=1 FL=1